MSDTLVWCDLEMTGLDPKTDKIIEMALIVTDTNLNPLDEGLCFAVHQPDSVMEAMDEWNTTHHGQSGLTQRVKDSKIDMERAQDLCLEYLARFTKEKESPLCGNSIFQDRMFLVLHAPKLNDFLHYRNIDVSTIKELVKNWYPELGAFEKKGLHRALDDIKESIEELKFYRSRVFRNVAPETDKQEREAPL